MISIVSSYYNCLIPSYSNYLEYLLYLASDWVESSVYVLTLPRAVCSCLWRDIPVARIIRNPSRLVLYLLFIMQCSRVKYLWGNCFSYIPRLQSFTNRYVIWGCQSALSKLFIYLLFIWTANCDSLRPQKIICNIKQPDNSNKKDVGVWYWL